MPSGDVWVVQVHFPYNGVSVMWSGHEVLSLFINLEVSAVYLHIVFVIAELS